MERQITSQNTMYVCPSPSGEINWKGEGKSHEELINLEASGVVPST